MSKNTTTFNVGITVGTITKMEMGDRFIGVWIKETLNSITLEHYVLVTIGVGRSLRVGDNVELKIEAFV